MNSFYSLHATPRLSSPDLPELFMTFSNSLQAMSAVEKIPTVKYSISVARISINGGIQIPLEILERFPQPPGQ